MIKLSLIIHPEFEKLKNKLSDLIFEYQELTLHICPNIEREYLLNFGLLEHDLYKRDVELSILKRKLSLLYIQINSQDEVNLDLIDESLKEEFLEYEHNIKLQMEELDELIGDKKFHKLSKKNAKRLKSLYKECVLKLHPDLHPDQSDYRKKLFIQITEAFQMGNLDALESLYYFIPNKNIGPELDLKSEVERLNELIVYNEIEIAKVKKRYPYNKKDMLSGECNINRYKLMLKNLIIQFDEDILSYKNRISDLYGKYSKN